MIHSKLKKGKTSQLLAQFSRNTDQWPCVIQKFFSICKQENVKVNKTFNILPEIIRFYTVSQQKEKKQFQHQSHQQQQSLQSIFKSTVQEIELEFTVIYIRDETYKVPDFEAFVSTENENQRVLLLRQNLDPFYHLQFEVQDTLSENESIIYLCELSAMIINAKHEKQLFQHEKKKERMIRKGNQGEMSQMEVIWRNILFQMPGIGKDKCKVIADKFPTYQDIVQDSKKNKNLKNLDVSKGTKSTKLGSAHAERIYKVFTSVDPQEKLY